MDRSRGHFSSCLSGNSQCAPVTRSVRWRGTAGRSFGSRSTPHPGMRARSSSLGDATKGLSAVYVMGRLSDSSRGGRHDERLDAVVELRREDVVAVGDVFQRNAVGDNVAGLQVTVANVV